jgi:hypothetical protein
MGWCAFEKHTDGSMQWIPRQIVAIGEDFHSQVGDGKVRTTLYKVRWEGYDKKDDTWEPITHLQGYATMVNASSLQCQEVGRRKGAKAVVVIWAYSVALV